MISIVRASTWTIVFALFQWVAPARADNIPHQISRPADFAYRYDIAALPSDSGSSLFELTLREEIYTGIAHTDLRDLRVFNGRGEPVPFGLWHRLTSAEQRPFEQQLGFFPIQGTSAASDMGAAVDLREDANGKVLSARFSNSAHPAQSRVLAYLVDLRKFPHAVEALSIDWTDQGDRIVELKVEGSDNLRSWHTVVSDAVVAKLSYEGEGLEQKRIEFAPVRYRFLKLSAADVKTAFELRGLAARLVAEQRVDEPRNWSKASGVLVMEVGDDGQRRISNNARMYDLRGAFPVDQMKVVLPGSGAQLLRIQVLSRTDHRREWTERYAGSAYRVIVEGSALTSPAIKFDQPISDRYWMLRVVGSDATLQSLNPTLEAGWVAHRLRFLGQGQGPFFLAYGSTQAGHADFQFEALLQNLKDTNKGAAAVVQVATLEGAQKTSGGASRLIKPVQDTPASWKKWLVWFFLGLGVLLIGAMAWQLYRDLGNKPADPGA